MLTWTFRRQRVLEYAVKPYVVNVLLCSAV